MRVRLECLYVCLPDCSEKSSELLIRWVFFLLLIIIYLFTNDF